ncbi:hypothetical protein WJX82_000941 [Trebouxia sp. C0006]
MRRHLACICCLLLVALVLGLGALTGYTGLVTGFKVTYHEDSTLEQLLLAKAIVDGPMKANSTSSEGARIYRQSKAQIQGYLEVCNQCRTYIAWAAFHIHQVTLKVVTPLNPLQAWGRHFVALVQTRESGRLVLSLAIIAMLAAFMIITVPKHKHYLYEQQPHSRGKASAEGVPGPIPKRLTLLQLLEVTHTDDLDAMVVFLLVSVHLVWRMVSGLATCLAMTWQACAFSAAAARTHLLSSPLQWTRSFLTSCLAPAKQGWRASMSRIAARLASTTTDDYLHDMLRQSENRALEAEGQTRHYSQRVRALEWQKFQDKQSDGGLAQKYDSLTALLSRTRQEKKQVEERLHDTFTHVSSLEETTARAEQSHAAEMATVITNLELSKKDLVLSQQARVAEANNSASLTAELQLLKCFCDSPTHKLAESGADLYISDHLRNGLEQRLEELTAQRDRLAYQAESLRNGKFAQDQEVRAADFKCVNLRQQLAEAHSAKTELTLHAYKLTAEKLAVCGQLLQVRGQNTQLASELTIAVTEKGKQGSERQLAVLGGQKEELQRQLTAAAEEAAQHATHIGRSFVAQERLQAQLTAKCEQNQQLADKVGELEADVSRLKAESLKKLAGLQSRRDASMEHLRLSQAELETMSAQTQARFERLTKQHAEVVQQVQQQRDREARAHSEEVTRLRDLLEAGAAVPDKQPNTPSANIPTPKHAPVRAEKAVPAIPSPSAKGIVSSGKATLEATSVNASIPGKGAPSVAQAFPANPLAAGSTQAGAAVPDKQPNNRAATIPTLKHAPVGAGKAVPPFPSPSAKGIVSGVKATPANASTPGKGAPSVAQTSPPTSPAAGSSQAGAAVPDKQPNTTAATIPTPKRVPVGAGKAVPAFPSPSAKGVVSSGEATPASASISEKGSPYAAQTPRATSPAAGSSQAGAAAPDKQPNNMAATIPTPRYAPVGAGKAVPAFPSPAAKGIVSSGKATLEASTANASIPGKGAPSVAQALPASPPAAGSSQTGAVVPNKQPTNTAANSPTPKLTPVGAGKAVPAFPSPSAKGIVSSGKGAPPAAGSSQAVLPALKKSPAQDKAVPSKPGTPKHGADRPAVAGPKPGSTPLRDLSNGSKPAKSSASSSLTDCAKSSHSADKKAVRDGTAATRLAGSKLDQPAAELWLLSASKESRSLTSSALDKGKSHSSGSTGMHAFSKGMSPHELVKGRAACNSSDHPKSRRAGDASSRTVDSTGVLSAQSAVQTQPSHFAFSPFRSVKGQQAKGQQEKSKAAPPLAALATTWSNPIFAYSTVPPSFCGSVQALSAVLGQTPFVSATKEHQQSPAGLVMSGSAGGPMMASTPAASQASDASHVELYAILDAGLLDSPSPTAGSFSSDAPAVRRRHVSPVPFGPLSSWTVADEDALQASAVMGSFSQAAVQTEGLPDFDNAHGVLANQMLEDVMSLDDLLEGFDNLLTPSSPQTWDASAASQEPVLQAGFDDGSLVSGGMEATSMGAHQHGGSQVADNPSFAVSGRASSEPAFTGAHDMELLAGDSSFLDFRGSKAGLLSHMTD